MVIEKKIETSGSDLSNCSNSPQKRSPSGSPLIRSANNGDSGGSPSNNKSRDTSLDSLVEAMDISSSSATSDTTSSSVAKLTNGHHHHHHHCQKRPNSDEKTESSSDSDCAAEQQGLGATASAITNNHHHHHHHHHHHQDAVKVKRNSVPNGHEDILGSSTASTSAVVNECSSGVLFEQQANNHHHHQSFMPDVVVDLPHINEPNSIADNNCLEEQQQQQAKTSEMEDFYNRAAAAEAEAEAETESEVETETEAEADNKPTPISILLNEEDKSAFQNFSPLNPSNEPNAADEQQQQHEQSLEEFVQSCDPATVSGNFSQIIELPLSKLKNNCNEFPGCLRIYLYVCDVFQSDAKYETDSMELLFQTSDPTFNAAHCPQGGHGSPVYKLALSFPHGILPESCSHKVKKKSIEILLEKASQVPWGNVGYKCRSALAAAASPTKANSPSGSNNVSSGSSFSTASSVFFKPASVAQTTTSFTPNQWTPFSQNSVSNGSSSNSSSDSDNLGGIDALFGGSSSSSGGSNNSLALVTYEEPIEPGILLDGPSRGKFYGYTGLDNLGNTCFMNSVLQCLSNTYPLRDYFLSGQFQADVNKENPLGTGGMIARAFALFLKQMWLGKQASFAPSRIKSLTGEKITSIFLGYGQHDAQEFMSFFLDAIHEDLNQNQNRPKIDYKKAEEENNPEKELFDERDLLDESRRPQIEAVLRRKADDSWHEYRLFNSSLIIDLFCGQYQSVLSCPDCNKKSIMFDPFLYIPLPIPPAKAPYEVIFFGREEATGVCSGSARYEILLAHNATAGDLLAQVSAKAGVPKSKMRLIEQQEDHISPKFLNSHLQQLADLRSSDSSPSFKSRPLLVFEVHKDSAEEVVELCVIQRSLEKMLPRRFLPFSNSGDPRVGLPFIITVRRCQLTYHHLCSVICSYAAHSVSAYRTRNINLPVSGGIPGFRSSTQQVFTFNLNEFCRNFASGSAPAERTFPIASSSSTASSTSPPPLHFVHYQTTPDEVGPDDLLAPFIIRKPNFGSGTSSFAVKSEEQEIVPPLLLSRASMENGEENYPLTSDDSDMSDASEASTVVGGNSGGNTGGSSSADDEYQQTLESSGLCSRSSGFISNASGDNDTSYLEEQLELRIQERQRRQQLPSLTEQAAMLISSSSSSSMTKMDQDSNPEEEEEEEVEVDVDGEVDEEGEKEVRNGKAQSKQQQPPSAQFDNDAPLELGNVYYLCCDWIDVHGYPLGAGVSIQESSISSSRHINFSMGSRNFHYGRGNSTEEDGDDDITLDDCFQLFSEPEVLGQQNCWKCPACRAPRAATKQLSFNLRRLPPILVVQLKRFKMAPNSVHRRKLSQLVKFPLQGLDLRKMQEQKVDLCGSSDSDREVPEPVYDLYAVVNHMGEPFMGHYTAYARAFNGEMGWRHFDDSTVSDVADEARIVSHNAYLLFYKRREKVADSDATATMAEADEELF